MQYIKYKSGNTIIEFHNSLSGKETVTVNGEIVSQKSSIFGIDHHFKVIENGETVRYMLRTKIGGVTLVQIDLKRNGTYLLQNEPVYTANLTKRKSKALKDGVKKLRQYDLEEAVSTFEQAIDSDPDNPDIHFYKACAHSLLEQQKDAFFHLQKSIELGLVNRKKILSEDALAFIRIKPQFEEFCRANDIDIQTN